MYERLAPAALERYGFSSVTLLPVQKGYRNEIYPFQAPTGDWLQLTLYKSEEGMRSRIARADAVASFVASKGLPARTRADDRTLLLKSEQREVFGALYHYLPGKTIPWEAYTRHHLVSLGKTMSDLHAALVSFDSNGQLDVIDECTALLQRMARYFNDPHVQAALKEKLGLTIAPVFRRYERLLEGCRTLPDRQQLHMDFVRGNVLFEDATITGILDFEKTSVGHPLFDVARTLAFLLVDCKYKPADKVQKYFLQSGYYKRGQARLAYYPGLLDRLVEFFLVHDFYKFLRHTPYESLSQNEHFSRTVTILVEKGVVHYS